MDEHYFHHILALLLNYEGRYVWEVGMKMADMIRVWGNKYKNIFQQLSLLPEATYPQRIKKLAIQLYFGRPCQPQVAELEKDVSHGVPFAADYQKRLNDCSRVLQPAQNY